MSTPTFDAFVDPSDASLAKDEPVASKGKRPVKDKQPRAAKPSRESRMRRSSKQDVSDSIRSLAMMLTVQRGELTPIRTLATQYEGTKLGAAYDRVAERIGQGVPFATALSEEEVFPAVVRRLVMVGARTGNPAPHLTKAADLIDETLETSSKVRSALLEPTILGVGVVIFFIAMVTWAVPQMVEVFSSTGAKVPALSQIALNVANVMQVVVPFLAAGAVALWGWWMVRGRHSDTARAKFDARILRVPVIGALKRDAAIANSMSVLSALVELGISERDALNTAAEGCDNRAIGAHLREHARQLTAGTATFSQLSDGTLIPLSIGNVLESSASSGNLHIGLTHVADTYRRYARVKSDNLSTALGPAANIVVGSLFAGAVIIIYVPMYSMFTAMTAF